MVKIKSLTGSLLVLLILGSVYSWSLFNTPLSDRFGHSDIGAVSFTFGIMTLFLAIGSSLSGFLKLKIGMQNTVALSAVCTGLGLMIAAFAPNLVVLYLSAGVLLGFGDGLGYMLVLTNCVKFFPKRKGLVSALCIGAYGLGSLLFKSIDGYVMTRYSLEAALLTWGVLSATAVTLGSVLILDAMQQSSVTSANVSKREYDLKSAVRTLPYWYLTVMFFIDCMVGLYIIGVSSNLGTALLDMSAADAAFAVSVVALANIAGRLIMGVLSDRLPRIRLITFDQLLSVAAVLMLLLLPLTPLLFFSALALIAFSFGGTLTIYPSLISDFFGIRNLAKNYGLLYLGFGIGSLFGYAVAVIFGSYQITFTMMTGMLIVAIVLSLMVRLPAELNEGHSALKKENMLYCDIADREKYIAAGEPATEEEAAARQEGLSGADTSAEADAGAKSRESTDSAEDRNAGAKSAQGADAEEGSDGAKSADSAENAEIAKSETEASAASGGQSETVAARAERKD